HDCFAWRALQESAAGNGWPAATRLRKSEPIDRAKANERDHQCRRKTQETQAALQTRTAELETHLTSWMSPIPTTGRGWSSPPVPSSPEPRTMKMQRHGRPRATAINTTRSREIGPAGGMAERTPRSQEMRRTNGNRAKPK